MKIHVKSSDGHNIKLWLPTSLLKSRFIINKIIKYSETDIDALMKSLPKLYKALKNYIKQHGHFILVNVKSADGDKVIIKV